LKAGRKEKGRIKKSLTLNRMQNILSISGTCKIQEKRSARFVRLGPMLVVWSSGKFIVHLIYLFIYLSIEKVWKYQKKIPTQTTQKTNIL